MTEIRAAVQTLLLEITRSEERQTNFVTKADMLENRQIIMTECYAAFVEDKECIRNLEGENGILPRLKTVEEKQQKMALTIAKWSGGIGVLIFIAERVLG